MKVNDFVVGQIVAFREAGVPVEEISNRVKVTPRTVRYWLQKDRRPSDVVRRKRAAKKEVVQRRKLVEKYATMKVTRVGTEFTPIRRKRKTHTVTTFPFSTPSAIVRQLATKDNLLCSVSTVRRDLLQLGFVSRCCRRVPKLSDVQKQARVSFARNFLEKKALHGKVLYSDEKIFDCNANRRSMWVKRGQTPAPREVQQYAPSLTAFIVIGNGFRKMLLFERCRMNKSWFKNKVLAPLIVPLRRNRGFLQYDNAPCHRGHDQYLAEAGVRRLPFPWPSASPDANPVEQINSILDERVKRRAPVGVGELRSFLEEEFAKIPSSTITKLCASVPHRLERIVVEKGSTIKP